MSSVLQPRRRYRASSMHGPAQRFLSLRALGAPAVVVSLALEGVFRGIGNCLAIFLFPMLMYYFKIGMSGAAISTVMSPCLKGNDQLVRSLNNRKVQMASGNNQIWSLPAGTFICVDKLIAALGGHQRHPLSLSLSLPPSLFVASNHFHTPLQVSNKDDVVGRIGQDESQDGNRGLEESHNDLTLMILIMFLKTSTYERWARMQFIRESVDWVALGANPL
ncbi:hypothetical protein L1987_26016 [Smallanthus sonchifolius]|uniref:Uncharacterized protein n=1 Tax=Smallanthus sonchifolius TaxID=185202 RepID=A0ACB9I9V7_9ASTR|nr:hypothetical protein L1987_26016 [Smallanthus sonchifolius]